MLLIENIKANGNKTKLQISIEFNAAIKTAFVSKAQAILSAKLKEGLEQFVAGEPSIIILDKKGSVRRKGDNVKNNLLSNLKLKLLSLRYNMIVGIKIINVGILNIVPTDIIKNIK